MCIATKDERGKPDVQLFLYNGRTENKALYMETLEFSDVFISFYLVFILFFIYF